MSIWIIRHAQSQSNAGLPTTGPYTNALSELGDRQAHYIPPAVTEPPDLIVISPYLRTKLTAQPLRDKFPQTPVEVWPIQEFTYLAQPGDRAITTEIRRPLSQAYWERCDPTYIDGVNAESFVQLMARVQTMLQQLEQTSGFRVVFTHGLFIKALLWQLLAAPMQLDAIAMRRFYGFWKGFRVPNASILKMTFQPDGLPYCSPILTHHLPPDLQSAPPSKEAIDVGDQPS